MKRKLISTFLALLGIGVIGFATLYLLGMFKEQEAAIYIETDPISKVFINGKEVGVTPFDTNFMPGEINVRIKPENINGVELDDYETKINLTPGIKTIIKRNFKSNEDLSSGAIVSFEKIGGQDSYVTVVTIPDSSEVTIDGKRYGYSPIRIKIPAGDHELVISTENYLSKSLPIKVYKGFKLTAAVKLAKSENEGELELAQVLSEKAINLGRLRINVNDVGYLRVRSGANTGFPEVAQVKPNEEYDILEEGEHASWYKIKIGEIYGWVKSEFVTKI